VKLTSPSWTTCAAASRAALMKSATVHVLGLATSKGGRSCGYGTCSCCRISSCSMCRVLVGLSQMLVRGAMLSQPALHIVWLMLLCTHLCSLLYPCSGSWRMSLRAVTGRQPQPHWRCCRSAARR
jgi:hypothetical protein